MRAALVSILVFGCLLGLVIGALWLTDREPKP